MRVFSCIIKEEGIFRVCFLNKSKGLCVFRWWDKFYGGDERKEEDEEEKEVVRKYS